MLLKADFKRECTKQKEKNKTGVFLATEITLTSITILQQQRQRVRLPPHTKGHLKQGPELQVIRAKLSTNSL